jgi:hypothetical protein
VEGRKQEKRWSGPHDMMQLIRRPPLPQPPARPRAPRFRLREDGGLTHIDDIHVKHGSNQPEAQQAPVSHQPRPGISEVSLARSPEPRTGTHPPISPSAPLAQAEGDARLNKGTNTPTVSNGNPHGAPRARPSSTTKRPRIGNQCYKHMTKGPHLTTPWCCGRLWEASGPRGAHVNRQTLAALSSPTSHNSLYILTAYMPPCGTTR